MGSFIKRTALFLSSLLVLAAPGLLSGCGIYTGTEDSGENEFIKHGIGLNEYNTGVPAICFDPSQPGNVWADNTWGAGGPSREEGDPAEGDTVPAPSVQ